MKVLLVLDEQGLMLDGCRFKGAWCAVWEKEQCSEIFGDIDVSAETLPEMADKIIAYSL